MRLTSSSHAFTVGKHIIGNDPILVTIPDPKKKDKNTNYSKATRIDLDGGLLFRNCPKDHPCLKNSTIMNPNNEPLILVGWHMYIDPKVSIVPAAFIKFITKSVIIHVWTLLLQVARDIHQSSEEISSGINTKSKRKQHVRAIEKKRNQTYDWIDERIECMVKVIEQERNENRT